MRWRVSTLPQERGRAWQCAWAYYCDCGISDALAREHFAAGEWKGVTKRVGMFLWLRNKRCAAAWAFCRKSEEGRGNAHQYDSDACFSCLLFFHNLSLFNIYFLKQIDHVTNHELKFLIEISLYFSKQNPDYRIRILSQGLLFSHIVCSRTDTENHKKMATLFIRTSITVELDSKSTT